MHQEIIFTVVIDANAMLVCLLPLTPAPVRNPRDAAAPGAGAYHATEPGAGTSPVLPALIAGASRYSVDSQIQGDADARSRSPVVAIPVGDDADPMASPPMGSGVPTREPAGSTVRFCPGGLRPSHSNVFAMVLCDVCSQLWEPHLSQPSLHTTLVPTFPPPPPQPPSTTTTTIHNNNDDNNNRRLPSPTATLARLPGPPAHVAHPGLRPPPHVPAPSPLWWLPAGPVAWGQAPPLPVVSLRLVD